MIKTRVALELRFNNDHASASVVIWPKGGATVVNLYSRKRGEGHATDVMNQICLFADDNCLKLSLSADSYGPGKSLEKSLALATFYKKFGFRNTGHNWMVRQPRKNNKR